MSASQLLDELHRLHVTVRLDGESLRLSAAPGVISKELQERVRAGKAELIRMLQDTEEAHKYPAIVPLQSLGRRIPVFAVSGHNGDVFCYRYLAQHLGPEQPFFGLQPPGLDGSAKPLESIEELARYFAEQVDGKYPVGPVVIAGYCAGGSPSFELARQLQARGREVRALLLIGTPFPSVYRGLLKYWNIVAYEVGRIRHHLSKIVSRPAAVPAYILDVVRRHSRASEVAAREDEDVVAFRLAVERSTLLAASRYFPRRMPLEIAMFMPSRAWRTSASVPLRWKKYGERWSEHIGPTGCVVDSMMLEPAVEGTATLVRDYLTSLNPASQ